MPTPSSRFQGVVDYIRNLRRFSRNAKLFLTYALFSNVGTGIWMVLFNLYLLRLGFDITFIGLFWFVDMLFHGLFAFPAGLIGDKIGRRKAFIVATALNLIARGALLFTLDPTSMLFLAAIGGMGEGFHAVAGAPFMMENSEPEERPHLFSLYFSFFMLSTFAGNIFGGYLPLALASVLGVPSIDPAAARWALVAALPITFVALLPLALMRERAVELVESFRDLFTLRNIVNYGIIFKLVLCSALVGIGFGLTIRFFNLFFNMVFDASDDQIGNILGIAALSSGITVLLSPVLSRRWGKVWSISITLLASIPFLLLMAVAPNMSLAFVFLLIRGSFYGISMPLRNQLSMEFVVSRERATTAGIIHMGFDLGGALGAMIAGIMIVGGEFMGAFGVAALLIFLPAVLYPLFFLKVEERQRAASTAR